MARAGKQHRGRAIAFLAAGIVALVLLIGGAVWQVSRSRCFSLASEVTCRVETSLPLVALTFDDGPTLLGVGAILQVLERQGARATFFLTGREAGHHPELVKAIVQAGHEVGNHSYTHERMILRSDLFYADEIRRTQATLARAGADSRTFRPPYGKKLLGLPRVVEQAGLRMIMWDIEDPKTLDPTEFAKSVVDQARPGSIILIHAMYPSNDVARAALPKIVYGLRAKGMKVVSVRELLEHAEEPRR